MTTYYVDGAVGSDANAGTSEGSGNAWLTIGKAFATVVAGDTVWIKATGTYTELCTVVGKGTDASPITFRGYTTTTGDNGKVTWDGTTSCITFAAGSNDMTFENIIFQGASGVGMGPSIANHIGFFNCEFNSHGSHGTELNDFIVFVNCVAHSNTGRGFNADNQCKLLGCVAYGNSDNNFNMLGTSTGSGYFYKCVAYGLAATKRNFSATSGYNLLASTMDGENAATSYGYLASSAADVIVCDNIFHDHDTALLASGSQIAAVNFVGYNLYSSNNTDISGYGGIGVRYGDPTPADPAFTDEANDDYTLGEASPAIGAGIVPGGIT